MNNNDIIAEHIRAAYLAGDTFRLMYLAHTLRASATEDTLRIPVQVLADIDKARGA
jgi:hypothetical protein